MADTQTLLTQTMTAAKEAFFSSMLTNASPAQAAEAAFNAMSATLEEILGEVPAQFAEMKAAAMAQFVQDLNSGLSAESAFNNVLAQFSTALADSGFGGLLDAGQDGGTELTLDDVLVLSRDVDGMLDLDDLGLDGVFGSSQGSYLNLLNDHSLLSGGKGGGFGGFSGWFPRTVGDDPSDYLPRAGADDGPGPGPGPGPGNPAYFAIQADAFSVTEGNAGVTVYPFTVTRSGNTDHTNQIDWRVAGNGDHPADNADFAGLLLPSGTLTFAPGETIRTINVEVAGDPTVEPDETFMVNLSNPTGTNAQILDQSARGIIINDDDETLDPPDSAQFSIALDTPVRQGELDTGETSFFTFIITRSGDLNVAHSVDWNVAGNGDHPADADDFGGWLPAGTVTFAAGESARTVTVAVSGDMDIEDHEGFVVSLSNPSAGARIAVAFAAATIVNDDSPVVISPCFPCLAQTVTMATAATSITMAGNPQCDIMNLDLVATTAIVSGYHVHMDGSGCGDIINADLIGGFAVGGNHLNILGATSSDIINVTLRAFSSATASLIVSGTPHVVASNTVHIDGGQCDDNVTLLLSAETLINATGTPSAGAGFAVAVASNNDIAMLGGPGNDTLSLSVSGEAGAIASAFASPSSPTSSSSSSASSAAQASAFFVGGIVTANNVVISGDAGNDHMSARFQAVAQQEVAAFGPVARAGAGMALAFVGPFMTSSSAGLNHITMLGGSGADTISLMLSASVSIQVQASATCSTAMALANGAIAGVFNNAITMTGGDGGDSLTVLLNASKQMSVAAAGPAALIGGSTGTFPLPFFSFSGVLFNNIDMGGGLGNDLLALTLSDRAAGMARADGTATAVAHASPVRALVGGNHITMTGGAGDDTLMSVHLNAQARVSATASGMFVAAAGNPLPVIPSPVSGPVALNTGLNIPYAVTQSAAFDGVFAPAPGPLGGGFLAMVLFNTISMSGAQGSDNLSLMLSATAADLAQAYAGSGTASATASLAGAYVGGNGIFMTGGTGNDTVGLTLSAEATGVAVAVAGTGSAYAFADAAAMLQSNTINISGGDGGDDVAVTLRAAANATADASVVGWAGAQVSASAEISGNTINLSGGSGDDALILRLTASATATAVVQGASVSAMVARVSGIHNNTIHMSGGSGSDTLELFVNNASGLFDGNIFSMNGGTGPGDGNDQFRLFFNARTGTANTGRIWGGVGSDTISITADTTDALFIFKYAGTNELGDGINGLTMNHQFNFSFADTAFNGITAGGVLTGNCFVAGAAPVATGTNHFWLYNTTVHALYYDADAAAGGAARLVAQFDADVGLTAGDITFY